MPLSSCSLTATTRVLPRILFCPTHLLFTLLHSFHSVLSAALVLPHVWVVLFCRPSPLALSRFQSWPGSGALSYPRSPLSSVAVIGFGRAYPQLPSSRPSLTIHIRFRKRFVTLYLIFPSDFKDGARLAAYRTTVRLRPLPLFSASACPPEVYFSPVLYDTLESK